MATKPKAKPPKMELDSPAYRRATVQVALEFCPSIEPCNNCGYPKVHGYRCTRCDRTVGGNGKTYQP